jgi:hypothetical protein
MRQENVRIGRFGSIAFAAVACAAVPVFAHAAGPDLASQSVSGPLAGAAGAKLTAKYSVRNAGSKPAPRSVVEFTLSEDKKLGKGDVALKGQDAVKALAPGKLAKGKASLRVPAGVGFGAYRLIACADAANRVKEGSEGNNCRTAKKPLVVTPQPRPLSVDVAPDSSRAVSQLVSASGGSLAAIAADGTVFTLEIPSGALLSDELITMTPLASIGGLPFSGGLAGGVQLDPEGLRLLKPATLRIEPATAVSDAERTGFAYRAAGQEFHLHPSSSAGGAITLELLHFSGYGAGRSSAQERSGFAGAHPPTSVPDQADQQAAAGQELYATALAMYAQILALSQARESVDVAVAQYGIWGPLASSTPAAGLYAGLPAVLAARISAHIVDARSRCYLNHDLREAAWIMRLAAAADQLGVGSLGSSTEAALGACLRFGLDMDAEINEEGDIEPVSLRVKAVSVPARLVTAADPGGFDGSGPLMVQSYSKADWQCWSHTWDVTPGAPVAIRRITFGGLNPRGGFGPAPTLASVDFDPGDLNESITHNCTDGDSYTVEQDTYRGGMYSALENGATGWSDAGGGVFRLDLEPGSGYSGLIVLALRHTPAP